MIAIIDTSSFVSLVRYYLPFDKHQVLSSFVKMQIENRHILMIDKVYDECRFISKGVVLDKLSYLKDKQFRQATKIPIPTSSLIAPSPSRFLSLVDNNFVIRSQKNRLEPAEYEIKKGEFLKSADIGMVLLWLNMSHDNPGSDIVIVTEETESSNDNKLFKKIPAICKVLDIRTISMPEYINMSGINVQYA